MGIVKISNIFTEFDNTGTGSLFTEAFSSPLSFSGKYALPGIVAKSLQTRLSTGTQANQIKPQ